MFFLTFVRLLPRRIAAAITAVARFFSESRALQDELERKHPQRFDR